MRWKWAIDIESHTLVLFEDGSAFEVMAEDHGEGDWAKLGKPATVYSEEGREWRPYRTLPRALRSEGGLNG